MSARTVAVALVALALLALVSLVGAVVIVLSDRAVPDFLVATGATCVGAVAGIVTGRAVGANGGG